MTRRYRITFRISEIERAALTQFATERKLTLSRTIRRFIADQLELPTPDRGWLIERRRR